MNAPKATTAENYGRDGLMATNGYDRYAKNYEPNSYGGPVQTDRPLSAPSPSPATSARMRPPRTPRTTTSSRPVSSTG